MTQLTQAIRNGKTDRIYGEKVKENTREAKWNKFSINSQQFGTVCTLINAKHMLTATQIRYRSGGGGQAVKGVRGGASLEMTLCKCHSCSCLAGRIHFVAVLLRRTKVCNKFDFTSNARQGREGCELRLAGLPHTCSKKSKIPCLLRILELGNNFALDLASSACL